MWECTFVCLDSATLALSTSIYCKSELHYNYIVLLCGALNGRPVAALPEK